VDITPQQLNPSRIPSSASHTTCRSIIFYGGMKYNASVQCGVQRMHRTDRTHKTNKADRTNGTNETDKRDETEKTYATYLSYSSYVHIIEIS
jgi:hypothetical protein